MVAPATFMPRGGRPTGGSGWGSPLSPLGLLTLASQTQKESVVSHEITIKSDGSAAAMYARTAAWHRLGTVSENLFTAKEALAETGLDFGVQSAPLTAVVNIGGVDFTVEAPDHKMTWRELDGKPFPLGVVGSEYLTINPADLFEFMDAVVNDIDGAHYTAAFGLRNWKQVVCVAETGALDLDPQGRGDKISKFIVGRTSHDGSLAFGLKWSNMRVECANMLAMHLREASVEWKTKHTTNALARVAEAKKTLGAYTKYETEWAKQAEAMIQTELTDGDFDRWLGGLMEAVKKENDDDEIDRDVMYSVRALYAHSPTNTNIRGTVWGALNAVTEFSDHALESRGSATMTAEEATFVRQIGDNGVKYGQPFKQIAWERSSEWLKAIEETDKRRQAQVKVPRKTKTNA